MSDSHFFVSQIMDVGLWHMLAQSHLYQTTNRKGPKHSLFSQHLECMLYSKTWNRWGQILCIPWLFLDLVPWSLFSLELFFVDFSINTCRYLIQKLSCFHSFLPWAIQCLFSLLQNNLRLRKGASIVQELCLYSILPPKRVIVSSTAFPVVPLKRPTTWKRSPLSSLLEFRVAPFSIIAGLITFLHISEKVVGCSNCFWSLSKVSLTGSFLCFETMPR